MPAKRRRRPLTEASFRPPSINDLNVLSSEGEEEDYEHFDSASRFASTREGREPGDPPTEADVARASIRAQRRALRRGRLRGRVSTVLASSFQKSNQLG